MRTSPRLLGAAAALAVSLSACGSPAPAGHGQAPAASPPVPAPPRSLVVLACSDQVPAELDLLESALSGPATPGEALVLIACSKAPHPTTTIHVVQPGENLSEIAASSGLALGELENLNPGLGPAWGRDWDRIVPGDLVVLPGPAQTRGPENVLTTRAAVAPPPPRLLPAPTPPPAGTDFQNQLYEKAARAAGTANAQRLAAWRAEQERQAAAWRAQVLARLRSLAGDPASVQSLAGDVDLPTALPEAVSTLAALPGRGAMLVLTDRAGPPALPSLAGLHVCVVALTDSTVLTSWSSAAAAAGAASVAALTLPAAQLRMSDVAFGG
jgi:hypothetical protein